MTIGRLRNRLRRISLLVRFGVSSAVLVTGLGLVLGQVLSSSVEERALTQSERTVASVGRLALQPLLKREDFDSGVISAARIERLQSAISQVIADGSVARVKVYDSDGTILYSDRPELIGQRQEPEEGLQHALAGDIDSELQPAGDADSDTEAELGSLLEVYVPVTMDDEVVGVFELYLPYAPVAAESQADVAKLAWWLVVGLLALWLALFQIMVTASRRLRQQSLESQRLAQHDVLTGLPNRGLFSDRAAQAVLAAKRSGDRVAVLLADLDRFREINETLGHHVGDQLIIAVGERLGEQVREVDTVARLGGNEYAVLLPVVDGVEAAREVADRLVASLRAPFVVDGVTLEIGASLGIACYPEHGQDATRLLQCADVAMYSAKHAHQTMIYDAELDVNTPARLALYGELRRGIEEGQLTLHYQPKVNVGTGRVVGAEALVRWHHPERGLIEPDDFIPLAEQTGLIRPMTQWVLRNALRECGRWHDAGHELTVAVNLSVRSLLDEGLVLEVASLLRKSGLPASLLELEITETTAMVEPLRSLIVLGELHALGVKLSLDDYGTGHSSLSYLNELPVDTLKIDRSFVTTMDTSHQGATIVRSTIDLARNLGLGVVAEGVETEGAWQILGELGCGFAQGYWLARPEPAEGLLALVARLDKRLATYRRGVPAPA